MTDPELLATFIARAIPPDQWTHETHLRVAWLFARDRPLDEAHILFRIALMKLNDRRGVPESLSRGYHGTITRAWLAVLGRWPGPIRAEVPWSFFRGGRSC